MFAASPKSTQACGRQVIPSSSSRQADLIGLFLPLSLPLAAARPQCVALYAPLLIQDPN